MQGLAGVRPGHGAIRQSLYEGNLTQMQLRLGGRFGRSHLRGELGPAWVESRPRWCSRTLGNTRTLGHAAGDDSRIDGGMPVDREKEEDKKESDKGYHWLRSKLGNFLRWGFGHVNELPPQTQWEVPWGLGRVCWILVSWAFIFATIGSPILSFPPMDMTQPELIINRKYALRFLLLDVLQLGTTIGLLVWNLAQFQPLKRGWFPVRFWPGQWIRYVFFASLFFPCVDGAAKLGQHIFPTDCDTLTLSLSDSLGTRDPVTLGLYFAIMALCAPLWEEIMFRGFLLPSLLRYMPMVPAILVSAVVFAVAHWNIQRLFPLVILGVLFGSLFATSRNLLSPILLHSLWNVYTLLSMSFR